MAAMTRAIATRTDRPLIDDPFAEPLVRAVGIDLLTRLATGELAPDDLVGQVDHALGEVDDREEQRETAGLRALEGVLAHGP